MNPLPSELLKPFQERFRWALRLDNAERPEQFFVFVNALKQSSVAYANPKISGGGLPVISSGLDAKLRKNPVTLDEIAIVLKLIKKPENVDTWMASKGDAVKKMYLIGAKKYCVAISQTYFFNKAICLENDNHNNNNDNHNNDNGNDSN